MRRLYLSSNGASGKARAVYKEPLASDIKRAFADVAQRECASGVLDATQVQTLERMRHPCGDPRLAGLLNVHHARLCTGNWVLPQRLDVGSWMN